MLLSTNPVIRKLNCYNNLLSGLQSVRSSLTQEIKSLLMVLQIAITNGISSNHLHTWNKAHISHKCLFSKKSPQSCCIQCSSTIILHAQSRDGPKGRALPCKGSEKFITLATNFLPKAVRAVQPLWHQPSPSIKRAAHTVLSHGKSSGAQSQGTLLSVQVMQAQMLLKALPTGSRPYCTQHEPPFSDWQGFQIQFQCTQGKHIIVNFVYCLCWGFKWEMSSGQI